MKLAVVGSREGADLEHVERFVRELPPGTVIVSGGAKGVDRTAEQTWLSLGGEVISFRVREITYEEFRIERWELGNDTPRVFVLANEPSWADYVSALFYRNLLIAEECDRLVFFRSAGYFGGGSFTEESARQAYDKPTFTFEAQLAA